MLRFQLTKLGVITVGALLAVTLLANQEVSAAEKIKAGGSLRLRHEFLKNNFDFNNDALDNRNYFRDRTSVWVEARPAEDIGLYTKLTNEFRAYTYYAPSSSKTSGKTDKDFHFDINEVVFDNLYLDLKEVASLPVDLRLGRQDLNDYGECFLICDGTPGDGSRTMYFNAFKTAWKVDEQNTVDFIYVNNPRDDVFLPIINEDKAPQNLNTTAEEGYILYAKNKSVENLNVDGYYIYKREGSDSGVGLQSQKGIINTVGSYAKYTLDPYTLRGQVALQAGDYGSHDREGQGGYLYLDRDFKDTTWSPKGTVGFIYLSGDDTGSADNEAFDPLFSRSSWLSDLYYYSYKTETGMTGYWTNLRMWKVAVALKPTTKISLNLDYNYLMAVEEVARTSTTFSGNGRDRGHLLQGKLGYNLNKNTTVYLKAEYFIPGDFYVADSNDALFLRTEMAFKF